MFSGGIVTMFYRWFFGAAADSCPLCADMRAELEATKRVAHKMREMERGACLGGIAALRKIIDEQAARIQELQAKAGGDV